LRWRQRPTRNTQTRVPRLAGISLSERLRTTEAPTGGILALQGGEDVTTWLVREYDAVFVEDLDPKRMLEQSHNAHNKQDTA
jgi:hypothetical protein